ncbi:MAG: adenylosuccinate synthase [Clostridiales bacterium]|jgi:adenylosuccinate synthase|nr:adenylosuccinate synthase [Clostridiales bacterium]MBQ1294331.1 adenylosuccinate synthase [Clostridiales bacterium]MBQ1570555.1 adenylosuccinate synthase [Clostridiales bacterium]MBQ5767406.1 adenylosuccinate synthase [Clostridiales bacterium]
MVTAIVGANWGDEGKGKITDLLANESDIVIRFQGGANAGHTIINDHGRFALHLMPSGVCHENIVNIIGNGVALDIRKFINEYNSIKEQGLNPQLLVSDRVQVVMPYHVDFDKFEEERLGGKAFGSTKSGIAPFFSDKYAKIGFQVSELFDEETLREKINRVLEIKNALLVNLYHKDPIDPEELLKEMLEQGKLIKPFVTNTQAYLYEALKQDKKILLEGQLGTMKDPDMGIYPMVTSSSTLAGYGCVGAGIPPYEIKKIVVVTKAYSSSVGGGAFVSEILDEAVAKELRDRGGDKGEYGATTGRPRRVGWFDCVATRYGVRLQGGTDVALTNLDVLGYLDKIPVCTAYEIDGEITKDFPNPTQLDRCKPVIEYLPSWKGKGEIRGITEYDKLPKEAQDYVEFIEKEIGVHVSIVSTGPVREEIIRR